MTLDLLQQLALAAATNEKAQRRFRSVVLVTLSKIETTVKLIHGAQIVEANGRRESEGVIRYSKDAEEFISQAARKQGLAMMGYIYGAEDESATRTGRKGKWSEWEI